MSATSIYSSMRRVEGQDPSHPVIQGLRWILSNRSDPTTGKPYSMRALSIAAGLQPTRVEQILNMRISADITRKLSMGLARAGQVHLEWLLTGEGPRDIESPTTETEASRCSWRFYQAREDGAKAARLLGVSEAAIVRVLTYTYPSEAAAQKISSAEWHLKMKDADLDIQSVMAKDRE